MTMVPPDEIPVYDYRAAFTELCAAGTPTRPSSKPSFTIDSMTTTSQVDGDTAKVTLKASGTTDSGKWSIDGGCFTPPAIPVVVSSRATTAASSACSDVASTGLDKSSQITVVKENGRWFVSPVGTVLDVVDHWINQIDRRSLFTLLGIPNELPPDGALTLGQTVTLDSSVPGGVTRILSFAGHKGENLVGQGKAITMTVRGSHIGVDSGFSAVYPEIFGPDGTRLNEADTLLDGQPFTLPADGTYTFVFQLVPTFATKSTVTVWDAADAPASAKQSATGGCTSHLAGLGISETCTSWAGRFGVRSRTVSSRRPFGRRTATRTGTSASGRTAKSSDPTASRT